MSNFNGQSAYYDSYKKLQTVLDAELLEKIKVKLIPVLNSADKLEQFVKKHGHYLIVPYLFHKDDKQQLLSTSSMHMNWLWPNVLYVPINIEEKDGSEIEKVYRTAFNYENVIFFNHTIPHKSNAVMQKLFGYGRGDYLARSGDTFQIADGNGEAFLRMARELAGGKLDFSEVTVVIVGVGEAGELAARAVTHEHPRRLILVDILDKSALTKELGAEFYQGIDSIPDLTGERLVIMDSTAHFEGGQQRTVALDLVEKYDATGNVFIDYNMDTKIGAYKHLKSSTGVGKEYVAITNYVMVLCIIKSAKSIGVELPFISKEDFDRKVAESVQMRDRIVTAEQLLTEQKAAEQKFVEKEPEFLIECMKENLNQARHVENERILFVTLFTALAGGSLAIISSMDIEPIIKPIVILILIVLNVMCLHLTIRWNDVFSAHWGKAKEVYELILSQHYTKCQLPDNKYFYFDNKKHTRYIHTATMFIMVNCILLFLLVFVFLYLFGQLDKVKELYSCMLEMVFSYFGEGWVT